MRIRNIHGDSFSLPSSTDQDILAMVSIGDRVVFHYDASSPRDRSALGFLWLVLSSESFNPIVVVCEILKIEKDCAFGSMSGPLQHPPRFLLNIFPA